MAQTYRLVSKLGFYVVSCSIQRREFLHSKTAFHLLTSSLSGSYILFRPSSFGILTGNFSIRAFLLPSQCDRERKRPGFHDRLLSSRTRYRRNHELLHFVGDYVLGKVLFLPQIFEKTHIISNTCKLIKKKETRRQLYIQLFAYLSFLLGRVIGAVIVIGGLYMVLWGKSTDDSPSKSTKLEVSAPKTEEDNVNDETNKSAKIQIQELEAIELSRVNSREESV